MRTIWGGMATCSHQFTNLKGDRRKIAIYIIYHISIYHLSHFLATLNKQPFCTCWGWGLPKFQQLAWCEFDWKTQGHEGTDEFADLWDQMASASMGPQKERLGEELLLGFIGRVTVSLSHRIHGAGIYIPTFGWFWWYMYGKYTIHFHPMGMVLFGVLTLVNIIAPTGDMKCLALTWKACQVWMLRRIIWWSFVMPYCHVSLKSFDTIIGYLWRFLVFFLGGVLMNKSRSSSRAFMRFLCAVKRARRSFF